jgi:tetratricopeptide (TPR) repeat protein
MRPEDPMAHRAFLASCLLVFGLIHPPSVAAVKVTEQAHREALEHYRAGQELLYAENWTDAEREFRAAVKLDPLLVLAHYSLGQVYMALKQYPDAVKAFTGCRQAYLDIAALQDVDKTQVDQRREEEIQQLRDGIRILHSASARQRETGQRENSILKLEQRILDLETSKRRGPTGAIQVPAEFSLALGSAYFRSGALADAEREYGAAVKARPKFGEAHNNLAVLLMLQGRLPEAKDHLKSAEKAGFHVNPVFKADLEKKLEGR